MTPLAMGGEVEVAGTGQVSWSPQAGVMWR